MALNEIAHNRTLAKSGYDLSEELGAAVDLVARAKASDAEQFGEGKPVSPFGRQQGLFDDEYGDSMVQDGVTLLLADVLNSGKPGDLRKFLAVYNNDALSPASGQMDMFSGKVETKEELLKRIIDYFENATKKEQKNAVDAATAGRKQRAEAAAQAADGAGRDGGNPSEATAENGSVGLRNDGRGRVEGHPNQRQGDLAETGDVDENGHPFISSSDGTTVFGEITEDSGLTAAPIKLSEGFNNTDEKGNNIGYGLLHIKAGHGQQILEAGYPSVEKFVEDVCRNYKEIRIGRNRKSNQTYMLLELHDEKHKRTLYVELSHDGTYWNVNSGGIFRNKYTDKNDIVWPEPTVGSNANTDTAEVADSPTEVAKGETVDRGGNSSQPISSVGKVKNNQSDLQGNGEKSSANEGETPEVNDGVPLPTDVKDALEREKAATERLLGRPWRESDEKSYMRAIEDAREMGLPAVDSNGTLVNEHVVALARWAEGQGLRIDAESKDSAYDDLVLECQGGYSVLTVAPDRGDSFYMVWLHPEADYQTLTDLAYEFNEGRKYEKSAVIDGDIEGVLFHDGKSAREFESFMNEKADKGSSDETPLSAKIDAASAEVNTEPTEAQKEAGNYKKGHVQVGTFDITIEQPEGSVRRGTDANGKQWESKMHNTYGYFRGTEGVDGDHIDVFLSNDIDGWNGRKVYVVDQYNPDGSFDEHKVMLGFNDADEARGDYLANYEKGWEDGRRIDVSAVNLEDFEKWVESSHRKTKPFAEYAGVKKETVENGILKGEKWRSTGEPEKYRSSKKGYGHDVVWQVGKKRYGSTTAERDLIEAMKEKYGGYAEAWNAYERGETSMSGNEAAILKALLTEKESKGAEKPVAKARAELKRKGNGVKKVKPEQQMGDEAGSTVRTGENKKPSRVMVEKLSPLSVDMLKAMQKGDSDTAKNVLKEVGAAMRELPDEVLHYIVSVQPDLAATMRKEGRKDKAEVTMKFVAKARAELKRRSKPRLQKAEDYSAFAEQYGLDAEDVAMYADGIEKGSSAQASRAMAVIGGKIVAAHEGEIHSLRDMRRLRKPVEKALKEKFGDVEALIEERKAQVEAERNVMEAARKRAEEEEAKRRQHLEELSMLAADEIDRRYADAIDRGDEQTAREMLDEAARRKGYGDTESEYQGVGAWEAPSNPGYATDAERRADVEDNAPDVNLEDMALGYSQQPDDYFTHPERYSQDTPHGLESAEAIRIALDALKRGEKDVKVKVYRAVPTSVKEGKLRNGDWVTPSRKYAEMHGEHRLEGKYRIIEDEVPANELWWDGNDANEWGYDNGKEYKYKNARNNRKLNDLVTRDDKGNVIPPSKRFNSRKADERYQRGGKVKSPSERERALRDAVTDVLRSNGMDVIDDVDVGQRVLDEANGRNEEARKMAFGEPYDYEKYPNGRVEPGLADKEVKVVKADANHGFANYREAELWARENIARTYAPEETGGKGVVSINYDVIRKYISKDARNQSGSSDLHYAVLKVLPEVVREGIDVETHPNFKKVNGKRSPENGVDGNLLVHRVYAAVRIGDKICRVKITMKENMLDKNVPNKPYSYEVTDISTKIEPLEPTGVKARSGHGISNDSISAAKLLKNVVMSYNPGEKILDASRKREENVREQKVYHGSQAEFDHFDHSHMGEGEGAQAYGWGTYVTEVEGIGRSYAEQNAAKHNNDPEYEEAYKNYSYAMSEYDSADTDYTWHLQKVDDLKELLHSSDSNLENYQKQLEEAKQAGDLKRQEELERKIRMAMIVSDGTKRSISEESERVASLKERRDEALRKLDEAKVILDSVPAPVRNLYTVEIPDDNGENYLDWDAPLTDGQKDKIEKALKRLKVDLADLERRGFSLNGKFGDDAFGLLNYGLRQTKKWRDKNAQRAISKFLSSLGFVGIKYPADFRRGGREDGKKNYVIFDEGDAKITDHVRFFRSGDGEAYGFTVGGKIYIDPRIANAETPVHEYAHLWASALRQGNPKEWQNVVGLMNGTPVWDEVKKRYPELETDDEIADEVIAAYSGRRGAERLREEAERIAGKDGDVLDKAEAIGALERVKRALAEFWKGVCDFLHIHYTSAEEVADRVMKDLLDGVDPRKFGGSMQSKARKQFIGEQGAERADHAEEVSRKDQMFLYGGDFANMKNEPVMSLFHASDGEREPQHSENDVEIINKIFNDELQQQIDGKLPDGHIYKIGNPGRILLSTGVPNLPIQMNAKRLQAKATSYGHDFELSEVKDLVKALQHPLAVFAYGDKTKAQNIIVPLQKDGRNFIVGLSLNPTVGGRKLEINSIRNVFPKHNSEWLNWISQGKALYMEKEKIQTLIDQQRTNLADVEYLDLDSVAKVVEKFENPKVFDKNVADEGMKFRLLDDDDPKAVELESLPESELVPVYRNVQAFEDDALGSPMAFIDADTGERRTLQGGKWNYSNPQQIELTEEQQRKLDELNRNGYLMVDGKKTKELQISDGLKFVKGKTGDAQLSYWLRKNPEDSGVWAAYNPYDHAIETPLNTQFSTAYKRPNLVVVRSLMPKSELEGHYHADYAKDSTGAHLWNNGRTLYLSRWSKIDKVLTREEEARLIDEYWKKNPGKRETSKVHRDYNHFVPQVRRELEKMGYRFELDGKELTPEESRALDERNWESRDVIPGREGQLPFVSNEDIARINAKMAGKWVGEPKEAMENEMEARVNELAERLHTPVRVIRSEEEVAALPSARQRRMKGSFNPQTGEVTIVVPNNANMADIENTFVHEVVGHDGLRVLFPDEEKLNNALDELYRVSNDSIQQTIDRMAQKMYDAEVDRLREKARREHEARGEDASEAYLADMIAAHEEAAKKREQFRRDATEEYGADLGGRIGEKGFEKMSAEEQTFWGKLKATLQKALQKLLEGLRIPGARRWSDKDWAFVLHEAYKRKRNGGKPSALDVADTMEMRRKTGYGETKLNDGKREQQTANEHFNAELIRYQNGEMDKNEMLHLGRPQGVMRAFLPDLPIVMRQRILTKGSVRKHNVAVKALANMPNHLSHPIFVFKRSDNALGVLTEMQDLDGKNVCVAIELNRQIQNGGELLEVNDIRSVHGRNAADIVYPIVQNGTLKWVDKEKGLAYLSSASRYVQQEIDKQDLNNAAKIVKNFVNPKISDENVADEGIKFRDGGNGKGHRLPVDPDLSDDARKMYERRINEAATVHTIIWQDSMKGLKVLYLGQSSQFLKDGGLANAEIVLEFDKLARKSNEGYKHEHPFDMADIKDLPKSIASPIAVFDNTNGRNDAKVILTELEKGGRNFIVAVQTVRQNRRGGVVLEVN